MRAALAAALSAATCAPIEVTRLELPELRGPSLVVAFASEERGPWTVAAVRADEARIYLTDVPREADVFLYAYATSLETLGLGVGAVSPVAPPCARSCDLLRPDQSFVGHFSFTRDRGETLRAEHWEATGPIPDTLRTALVPDQARCTSACLELRSTILPLDRTHPTAFTARDADGSGLVVLKNGDVFRVRSATTAELVCSDAGPDISTGFFEAERRRLWLGGLGVLATVDLSLAQPGGPCPIRLIDPPPRGEPLRMEGVAGTEILYALSSTGAFSRFDGRAWSTLTTLPLRPGDELLERPQYHALLTSPPDRAMVSIGSKDLVTWDGGLLSTEGVRVPGVLNVAIQTLLPSEEHGLVLGIDNAGLTRRVSGEWQAFSGSRRWNNFGFTFEIEGRMVFGAGAGQLGQYVSDFGYCPEASIGLLVVPRLASRLSDRTILIGEVTPRDGGPPTTVVWVDARAACEL